MTNTTSLARTELRDETESIENQGYRLVRVHAVWPGNGRNEPYKVRIEVRWDTYERQSFAAVSVLSADLKWTHLAAMPTTEWYGACASVYAPNEPSPSHELGWVADSLLTRAATILA